jgi:gluconate 5-dehydrogenase
MGESLFSIAGKIALVTGSSRGLGLELARGLGKAGASVVLNGRDGERLHGAVRRLETEGITTHGFSFDVRIREELREKIPAVERDVGPIDILINNAGINLRGPMERIEEPLWNEVIATNLTGAFFAAAEVAQGMIERRRGKIINICSLMSELGRPTTGPYTASKGGLKMLTKAMAVEWARHNIQVNGIGPGYFKTEMTQPLVEDPEFDAWVRNRTPAGRWGLPAELIGPLLFLASEASQFVTGHILYVDGGILAAL